jgi:phosphoribosylamine--glycine ligase
MRLEDDLLLLMQAACDGVLGGMTARWRAETALTVVMAAKGYPGAYAKGTEIRNLEAARRIEGVEIFHAGTRRDGDRLMADGGRVLNVTALGRTVAEARERAYRAAALIDWPEGFYRRDIGRRAIEEAAR